MPSAADSKSQAPIEQGGSGKNYGASKIRDMKKFKPNSKPIKQKTPQTHKKTKKRINRVVYRFPKILFSEHPLCWRSGTVGH